MKKRKEAKPGLLSVRTVMRLIPFALFAQLWLMLSAFEPYVFGFVPEPERYTSPLLAAPVPCPLSICEIPEWVNAFSEVLVPLVGFILMCMLIYAGVLRLTAGADPEKEKKSRKTIEYSIIGTFIIVMAREIVNLIASMLGF